MYEQSHQPLVIGAMSLVYGLFGRPKMAQKLLAELQDVSRTAYLPPAAFAFAYLGLGDDRTSMPLYDGTRDDPRFRALLARMHLA